MSFRLASSTRLRLRNGKLALSTATAGGGDPPPPSGNAATSLTLTDIAQPVLQRDGASKIVNVAFLYTGNPDAVQARAVDYDTGVAITGWASTTAAPADGVGMVPLEIPEGKNYRLQIRDSVNTALVASGTYRFGVGMINMFIAQSNGFNAYDGTVSGVQYPITDLKSAYEWDRRSQVFRRPGHIPVPDTFPINSLYPTNYTAFAAGNSSNKGDGPIFWCNIVSTGLGIPVLNLLVAASGSSIDQWLPGGNCWDDFVLDAAAAVGGDFEHATFHQGENNATSMLPSVYEGKLAQLHGNLMTLTGRDTSSFKLGIMAMGVGPYLGSSPGEFGGIRTTHVKYANTTPGAYLMSCAHDGYTNSAGDSVHLEKTSLSRFWRRAAKSTAAQYGVGTSGAGPRITGAVWDGSGVVVTFAHSGGTALQDGAGGTGAALTGFEFLDGVGTAIAHTASAITGNTTVRFALPSQPATMSYALQDAPHGTPTSQGFVLASALYDNATYLNSGTMGCILQPCAAIAVT